MPNPATPKMRDLAQRVLDYETVMGESTGETGPVAFRACHKLRRPLCTLAGVAGCRSLMARALTLAKEEVPALHAVQVGGDGFMDFLGEKPSTPDGVAEGGIVLVAQLLGLLVILIGEPLMLRQLREIWPEVSATMISAEKN